MLLNTPGNAYELLVSTCTDRPLVETPVCAGVRDPARRTYSRRSRRERPPGAPGSAATPRPEVKYTAGGSLRRKQEGSWTSKAEFDTARHLERQATGKLPFPRSDK